MASHPLSRKVTFSTTIILDRATVADSLSEPTDEAISDALLDEWSTEDIAAILFERTFGVFPSPREWSAEVGDVIS